LAPEKIVEAVRTTGVTSVLLHGSRSIGSGDASSDYDVLCVVRPNQGRQIRDTIFLPGAELDVYCASGTTLKRRLYAPAANNNNFVLNALISGRILLDDCGELSSLVEAAQELWKAGPPGVPVEELILLRQQLKSALLSAERKLSRARDPVSLRLIDIRAAEIFAKAVYTYCVQQRHWTSSLASVLEWARTSSAELYVAAHNFLASETREQSIHALSGLLRLLERS
jgi:hypothetical protein